MKHLIFTVPVAAVLLFAACGGDDADRHVITIVQSDTACTPDSIDLSAGEKVTFEVRNESGDDQEIEGEDGTRLEELLVPSGKTRSIGFTAPDETGTGTIKCYRPGGQETLIELRIR